MAAGRAKDIEFCDAAVRQGFVRLEVLRDRLAMTDLDASRREDISTWISGFRR